MVEQQKQRIEHETTKLIDELDKQYLRKLQLEMHRCAARCCEDSQSSLDRVQRCVEKCSVPLQNAQTHVQTELDGLQKRLQRCVMDCNDHIKDKMGPDPSEADVARYTQQFEDCAMKCVDKHVELIPICKKNIIGYFNKILQNPI